MRARRGGRIAGLPYPYGLDVGLFGLVAGTVGGYAPGFPRFADSECPMSADNLLVLVRPRFSRCNLNCYYCPYRYRKHITLKERLANFSGARRFRAILAGLKRSFPDRRVRLMLVPNAELLISRFYRRQMRRLLGDPYFERISLQTNLCVPIDGLLRHPNAGKLCLWTTFHPEAYTGRQRETFFANMDRVKQAGVSFSVGVVATRPAMGKLREYEQLFAERGVRVWINTLKNRNAKPYSDAERELIRSIDPHARYELETPQCKNAPCGAGAESIFIDGEGMVTRCAMINDPKRSLGNIRTGRIVLNDGPAPCHRETCPCYIGYMNLKRAELEESFGDNLICRMADPA